ncbi:Zinc finger protein 724-like, partial [Homarus americanus]
TKFTCGKCFSYKSSLKNHIHVHYKRYPNVCTLRKIFSFMECCKVKRMAQFMNQIAGCGDPKNYVCVQCCELFDSNDSLKVHTCMAEHIDVIDIKCEEVDGSFNSNDDVTQHVTLDEKDIKCELDDESFNSNNDVTQRVTVDEKDIKYQEIDKKKIKEKQMKKQMVVHTDEKNFKNKNLRQHKALHTGQKKFQCGECGKRYYRKGHLKEHLLVHTGDKKIKCEECGKGFYLKGTLKRHMVVHS